MIATLGVVEFLQMRASERGGTERGVDLWETVAKHVPADCGRHCAGHDDEAYPLWPCEPLLRKAAEFSCHPDYDPGWCAA